jgi:hypothetical protein
MKAKTAKEVSRFTNIPNIGPAIAADFLVIGINKPTDLKGKDPFKLYQSLNKRTGSRHDPCVLDTFMAAVDFMNGAPAKAWWKYTQERKRKFPNI